MTQKKLKKILSIFNRNISFHLNNRNYKDTSKNKRMLYPDDAPNREETQNLAIKPLVTFGILTDVQYADIDDGMSYDKTRKRYYRNSLNLVKEAIANWKQHETENQCKIKFILQLGDIIDLQAKLKNETDLSLDRVITELNRLFPSDQSATTEVKLMHIWGNHEMYNYKRDVLSTGILNTSLALGQNSLANTNCYTYDVTDKLRLICLDFYRFSILGYDETHPDYINALALIQTHNKNEDLNQSHGLRGHALRFCKFNGGLGEEQIAWFEKQLAECAKNNIRTIVCGHCPVHAQASEHMCLAWDAKKVLEIMWSFKDTVIGYFSGHDHKGGYFRDKNNIHHITFHAMLETAPNSNAYATVKVYQDKVSVEGVGMVGYYEIYFDSFH